MARVIISLTLLVVFATFASAYYSEGDACYVEDPKEYGYYAPHPIYCYRYLQCVHGRFVSRTCSPRLHWSQKEGICDWPENVGCQGLTTERASTPTPTTTTTYNPTTEYDTTYSTYSTVYEA